MTSSCLPKRLVPWLLVALLCASARLVQAEFNWGCPDGYEKIGSCAQYTYSNYGGPRGSGSTYHEDWIGQNGDEGCANVCRSQRGFKNGCCSINSECMCHNST